MRELDLAEHKEVLVGIMDCIHAFCEAEGIRYFLLGGTLIGAVRHGGFIPWDDDMDIGMLRDDYERFCRAFGAAGGGGRYRLVTVDDTPGYYLPFAKVIDTRTVLEERIADPIRIGAFVDVFPLDSCPGDLEQAERFARKADLYRQMLVYKKVRQPNSDAPIDRLKYWLVRLALSPFSREGLIRKIEAIASERRDDTSSKYIAELSLYIYGSREIWERAWFDERCLLPFEGREYWAPAGYDGVLRREYGDYMELPPVEKRAAPHNFEVWWAD